MTNRLLLLALLLSITCPAAWAQGPAGAEFQANSFTNIHQYRPAVASHANGNFVVVWQSYLQDGASYGVFGQRFTAAGLPLGSEFQVNSYTPSFQSFPAVASTANGNIVAVWQSYLQDGSSYGVFGQRFTAAGLPLGSEFQVNSYTTNNQDNPAVASDANGNFVVVWESDDDGSSYGVFGRRFNASGVPQSSEFRANTYTTNPQFRPDVGSDADGNFVVVWASYQDLSGWGVFGQRFDAFGLPQGPEFRANSHTTSFQLSPAVASDADGNFVVVWQSFGQDLSHRSRGGDEDDDEDDDGDHHRREVIYVSNKGTSAGIGEVLRIER